MLGCLLLGALLPCVPSAHAQEVGERQLLAVRDRYPDWSPSGDRIVFDSDRTGIQQIFVIGSEGGAPVRLTRFDAPSRGPVFSPDGARIAFQSERDGVRAIFVMRSDGSEPQNVTHPPGSERAQGAPLDGAHPKWSPDGESIVFNGSVTENDTEIYEIGLDGTGLRRLTHHPGHDTYPSISPDGRLLLWRRIVAEDDPDSAGNSEIFIANRDGSEARNLTSHPAFDGYPAWLPSGEGIVFASNRGGAFRSDFHVYAMRPDGSGVTRLTRRVDGVPQVRPSVSPDGRAVAFNRDFRLGSEEDGRTTQIFVRRFAERIAERIGTGRGGERACGACPGPPERRGAVPDARGPFSGAERPHRVTCRRRAWWATCTTCTAASS